MSAFKILFRGDVCAGPTGTARAVRYAIHLRHLCGAFVRVTAAVHIMELGLCYA